MRKLLVCFYWKRYRSTSPSVQPRTNIINNSTHLSSSRQRSPKIEYPNISAASASVTIYEESRIHSLPVGQIRPKLDEKTEKHFSSLMMKRKTKELICPEGMDEYREVGGVLMLGKQIRQPVEDTF